MITIVIHLELERFVEHRVQRFPVYFRLELLLLVRQQVNLHVRVRCTSHVQGGQVFRLDHRHRESVALEIVFHLKRDVRFLRTILFMYYDYRERNRMSSSYLEL